MSNSKLSAQPAYDQTALELCDACGWKALIQGDCCLNCERDKGPNYSETPSADIHSCSYFCNRPACIKSQRDEMRDAAQATDAERYRFLRSALTTTDGNFFVGVDSPEHENKWALEGCEADKAIDAAIAASKGAA